MTRRWAATLGTVTLGVAIGTMATGMLGAPAGPCGPQGQLAAEFAKNVDPKARCFEVRMYTVDKARLGTGTFNGGMNELHQRFREQEVAIFQKHGAQIVGVFVIADPKLVEGVRDRAERGALGGVVVANEPGQRTRPPAAHCRYPGSVDLQEAAVYAAAPLRHGPVRETLIEVSG